MIFDSPLKEELEKVVTKEDCEILELDEEDGAIKAAIAKKAPVPSEILKVDPAADYPIEGGCFLRGNDRSPVSVVVTLNAPYGTKPSAVEGIPSEIERLVRAGIESGAAIAGTLQTENIGIEKIVCNVAGNPNIRFLVLCGNEVEGHGAGDALRHLLVKGIDGRRVIVGSKAVTPYLFNISLEAIRRFRKQVTLVDLLGEMDVELVRKAVWTCYQEKPTQFKDYTLYDPGAYPGPPISCPLTWRVRHPESVEEWEIDDLVKEIEEDKGLKEAPERLGREPVKLDQESREKIIEPKIITFIGRRLLRISEELADIAELCGVSVEKPKVSVKAEKVLDKQGAAQLTATVLKDAELAVEEDEVLQNFTNQLRGYNGVFAAFDACAKDICNNGCTFPAAVISTEKKLKKLKADLENSAIPSEKKRAVGDEIDSFLERLKAFPEDKDKPCQKTAGNCTIGSGCFVTGAMDLLKRVAKPVSPNT